MLNHYFKRPLFWDYLISTITCITISLCKKRFVIIFPKEEYVYSITSDLSTISLTLSGFILTLLTVLITFKSSTGITKENYNEDNTVFELFFASDLYFETVKVLKDCIKSLVFISVIGYTLKLAINIVTHNFLFYFNVLSLIIILLTLSRSLFVLSKIIDMQKGK